MTATAWADAIVPTRTIRSQKIIDAADLTRSDLVVAGTVTKVADLIGMEARVVLYAGRPIKFGDVGPPALVERNATVVLIFRKKALSIATEGRALARGAEGDRIRVLNLTSRNTVAGRVDAAGRVIVGPNQSLLEALE